MKKANDMYSTKSTMKKPVAKKTTMKKAAPAGKMMAGSKMKKGTNCGCKK